MKRTTHIESFTGKERDEETGYGYFGARYMDHELMTMWLSVDPMADKYPGISPYAYCAWNPVKLVDPDGRKDRPFRQGIDKEVSENIKTRTPVYIYNDIGKITDFHPDHKKAYNCHSYAWHNSKGDSNPQSIMPCDIKEVDEELPKWDNNPADDIIEQGAVQLGADENNLEGDRVIYYSDENGNGRYDDGEYIAHSAIVLTVDAEGYTTTVIAKMGAGGISVNHPCAPGYYEKDNNPCTGNEVTLSRAYFGLLKKEESLNE